jgi:hypothetical protein
MDTAITVSMERRTKREAAQEDSFMDEPALVVL